MKSNIFQKGFQLLYNVHACGTVGVLLGAVQFFLAKTGRQRDTPFSQNPAQSGCNLGGKKKKEARIAQGSDLAPDQLWLLSLEDRQRPDGTQESFTLN